MDFNKKKEGKRLLTLGVIIALINGIILLSALSYTIYLSFAGSSDTDLTFEDVPIKISQTSAPKELVPYYDKETNLLFEYDLNKYLVDSDGTQPVITLRNTPTLLFEASVGILEKADNDPISNRIAFYESLFGGVQKEEQATVEGLPFARISYPLKSSMISPEAMLMHSEIIYTEIDNRYVYIITTHPSSFDSVAILSDLSALLKSSSFSSEESHFIKSKSLLTDVGIEWDARIWDIGLDSNLGFTNKGYRDLKVTLTPGAVDTNVGSEALHNIRLEGLSKIHNEESFTHLKTSPSTINDLQFIVSEYEYSTAVEVTGRLYTVILEDEGLMITAEFVKDSVEEKELKISTFLSTIKLSQETVLGESSVTQIEKGVIIGTPAVNRVVNVSCANISLSKDFFLEQMRGKQYSNLCSTRTGTAFFIGSDGLLATNGHVAAPNSLDILIDSYDPNNAFWKEYSAHIKDYVDSLQGPSAFDTQMTLPTILALSLTAYHNEGTIEINSSGLNYIELEEQIDFDSATRRILNISQLPEGKLISGDSDSFYNMVYRELTGQGARITTPDLALLKIEDSANIVYPALKLAGSNQLISGQKIFTVGFPSASINETMFSNSSERIPTVTTGTLSALRQSPGGQFNLIQIDATISQGNSGGPILDSNGSVLGVATYRISQSQLGYNAGISVEELSKLIASKNLVIKESTVTNSIDSGLSNFGREYYSLAVKDFDLAKASYPLSSLVLDPVIAQANVKISSGEDKSPNEKILLIEEGINSSLPLNISGSATMYLLIGALGLIFSLVLIVLYKLLKRRRTKNSEPAVVGNPDATAFSQPIQFTPSQAPVVSDALQTQQSSPTFIGTETNLTQKEPAINQPQEVNQTQNLGVTPSAEPQVQQTPTLPNVGEVDQLPQQPRNTAELPPQV